MVAKTLILAGAALLAAIAVAGPAAAQQRGAPQGGPDGSGLLSLLDKNHDGVVDKSEVDAAAEAAFARADRNNDGKLSQAELAAAARKAANRAFDWFAFGQNRNNNRGPAFNDRRGPRFYAPGPYGYRGPFYGPRFAPRGPQFNQPLNPPGPRYRGRVNPQPAPTPPIGPQATPTPPASPAPLAPPARGNAAPAPGNNPAFNAIDTNHDGVISPDEFDAARNRLLPNRSGRGLNL